MSDAGNELEMLRAEVESLRRANLFLQERCLVAELREMEAAQTLISFRAPVAAKQLEMVQSHLKASASKETPRV